MANDRLQYGQVTGLASAYKIVAEQRYDAGEPAYEKIAIVLLNSPVLFGDDLMTYRDSIHSQNGMIIVSTEYTQEYKVSKGA